MTSSSTVCALSGGGSASSSSPRRRRRCGHRVLPTSAALVAVLLAVTVRVHPVDGFSTSRQQQQLERLLGGGVEETDATEVADASHISKRESKGTCTCTCETRPVAVPAATSSGADHQAGASSGIVQHPSIKQPENRIPETAALIRTAASMKDSTSRPRQPAASQQPQQGSAGRNEIARPQSKASAPTVHRTPSNTFGHIVKVPPIADDYEAIANGVNAGSRSEDQYDESGMIEKTAQDNEQNSNGIQDNWSVDSSERWPWERLPDRVCLREHCVTDRNCCRRWNICDKSAHVCTDCWYGSTCISESDCCLKYKYCQREWKTDPLTGQSRVVGGKCVDEL